MDSEIAATRIQSLFRGHLARKERECLRRLHDERVNEKSASPFVPIDDCALDQLVSLCGLCDSDFLIDAGSGDGKLCIGAAERVKGVAGESLWVMTQFR
jgi:IQ calmodulin-binding motif-containing protein